MDIINTYLNANYVEILLLLKMLWLSISIFWLLILMVNWFKKKNINAKWIGYGIFFTVVIFVATASFLTIATFEAFKNDPISKYELPPHKSWIYFYGYAFFHFWLIYVYDLAASLVWTFFLLLLYKYSKKRFLDEKEIILGFFTTLVIGWPNFVIYIFITFGLLVLAQIANYYVFKKREPVRLAPYMIIGSLVVIVLMMIFNDQLLINKFKLISRPFF